MGGVKFNSGVRYSQWAINSRLYDFRGNQKAYGFKKWNSGTESLEEYANKKNMKLDYVAGLVGKATLEASDYYVDFDWAKPWFKSAQAYATDYPYSAPDKTKITLDNMNAAKMAFHIINNSKWGEETAKTTAKSAIEAIITDLKYYNEYNVIGGTNSEVKEATANDVQKKMLGGWFHKYIYVDQVWCDGMYMGPALLAQLINYKNATNNVSNDDWSLLTKQFSITWEQLRDSKTGLLYHGMTATPTITDWSKATDATSYHSGAFWGRANAWYMLALVDVLELMPASNTNYSTLKGYLENLATSIASYQNADGTWYQVLDQKDNALDGNYEESSCSALFTAAYLKALRLNLLESSKYETMAKKAYVALVNKFMAYDKDDNNKIQILGSCCSAGLGTNNNKLRDGSRSYYINGNDSKVVTGENTGYYYTEGKVLGGFIMAATEYERAYQNQNPESKQILFAKDLAPSYDFTTTDGKLDATAYGSVDGNITYQWYKSDKTKIANAKYATYAPTEDGSYYCEATANGNTITTSTTKVTAKNNSNTGNGSTDNSEVIYDFTGSVGTTSYGTSCTIDNNVIKFSSNFSANEGKYITIKPNNGGFKAGDVITLNGYCNSKNLSGVIIYSDVKGSSIFKSNTLATSAAGGSEFTYTIEKDCDALYLGRYGGGTTCLTSLQVERPASSSGKTRLTASFERNADVVVNTTTTVTLPTLTVKVGEATLTANKDYTVVYKSNAEDVATLSGNTITINSLGIATITATVTPKNTDTYEGTTATYQLSVKAPSPLNVSVMDVTINTTDAEEEQPVIKVYGDNDKLLKLGQDYTLSYTVSGNNVTVDETGKFSVKKNAEKTAFIKGTSLITVTATPTASLGSNYIAGTLQFSYSVSEGKIKPVFLESFKGITINLHQDSKNRTITVPLIYNGEDVSSYFIYTYTITPTDNTSSVTGSELNYTPSTAGKYTVTVSAKPDPNGTNDYRDVYDNPESITFTLNVDSKYKTISVNPDPRSIKMDAGTTQVAPDLTVKTETTTLDDTEYNTLWFSTSPGIVKVDAKTGKIEAVSEGTAKIRVVVTGENLESTTALITVEVDDRALYRVKGPESDETYGNQTRMWNQDGTLSVVLGGWMFPNPVTTNGPESSPQGPSAEGLSAKYHWGPGASKAKWKLTGFDYYVAGDNNKNARQENGSNALPETTYIYSADFVKYKGTIKDNMFNVPCSGSYLEFNPVTNGKVTAHIFQNGVFDAKTEKDNTKTYQYRPQRRVFVMDEAGNFVESTAHIESTNGKPTGGIQKIGKYTWDLDSKTLTIGDVRSHFKGIPDTFDMTAEAFKNNVYESLLDTKKVPNAAANDRKGSMGWSVLADSPVTYTFNVKAGKTYYLYNFGSKIGFYGFSFDEGDTKPVEDVVSYAENQANTITATEAGHVAKVTINRSMTAGVWTTCVLPFSLNRQQVDAIFGPAYSAAYPQGTQILYFDRVENGKVYFVRHAYNTIVANKPFLIKPSKKVESISTAAVDKYPYVTIEATKNENGKPDDWCTGNGYTWASSYSNDMTVQVGDGFISKDGLFKNFVGESGTLKGFRGYLKRTETQPGAKPTMLQVVNSSNVDGDNGETTGIEDLIIDADGQLMPANGKVYNINGQLVSEDANSFQSLPSGIYIINGKKYIK